MADRVVADDGVVGRRHRRGGHRNMRGSTHDARFGRRRVDSSTPGRPLRVLGATGLSIGEGARSRRWRRHSRRKTPGRLHQGGEAVLQENATARYQFLTCRSQLQVAPVATGAIGRGLQESGPDKHPVIRLTEGSVTPIHEPGPLRVRPSRGLRRGSEPAIRHVLLGLEDAVGRSTETGGQSMQTTAQITMHSTTIAR